MNLTITVEGIDEQIKGLEYVERGLVDFRQLGAWRAVAKVFYRIVARLFDSEGSTGKEGKWAPLSPKYAAIKRARYGDQGILTASGSMRRSLTDSNAENAVYDESPLELVLGTRDPKARYHQTGTRKMPKREIIGFTDQQEKELLEPVYQKLDQLIDNAKLRHLRGF